MIGKEKDFEMVSSSLMSMKELEMIEKILYFIFPFSRNESSSMFGFFEYNSLWMMVSNLADCLQFYCLQFSLKFCMNHMAQWSILKSSAIINHEWCNMWLLRWRKKWSELLLLPELSLGLDWTLCLNRISPPFLYCPCVSITELFT